MIQEAGEADSAPESIMDAAKSNRLRQISRQLRGITAFDDTDDIKALALTSAQSAAIQRMRSNFADGPRRGPMGGPGGPGEQGGPPPDGERGGRGGPRDREMVQQILAQLT